MYPTLLIFLLFLISSSFSQFDFKLTKESIDLITNSFIKVRGNNGSLHDFRSFSRLLDRRKFLTTYHKTKLMGYDGFLHFLKTHENTFSEVELMPDVYQNQRLRDDFDLFFTLRLTNIMNYTIIEKYHVEVKFLDDQEFRIVKLVIELEDGPKSIWKPKYLDTGSKAREFAKEMSKLIPFKVDKTFFAEENFMALIETDYNNIFNLDDFMVFITRFNQTYEIQQNSIKSFEVITEANDHVVFRAGIPIKYSNKPKKWYFEIEASYIQNSWKILKVFVRHPFDDNRIIVGKASHKLYVKLKNEFKNLLEVSNIIEIPEMFTGKVKNTDYSICELFSVPENDVKIKLPKWNRKIEILGDWKYHTIIIQLYYPDEGRLVNFKFKIEYNAKLDISEIVQITVQCPEYEHSDVKNFKDQLLDLQPISVFNKQEMLNSLLQQLNETIPFNNPDSVRNLFAPDFKAVTTIYPDQSYGHNWDSFKKFMRLFNGKYLYIDTSSNCSFGKAGARIMSQGNSKATLEVTKIFQFKYELPLEDQQLDLWKFVFEINWDSSEDWKIQRIRINPINQVGKYRAALAVQQKTQNEVERIAKLQVRKIFFDPEWAEYFQTMYSRLYGGNVPWELNSTFVFDKYNIHRTRPLTTIFKHKRDDPPTAFTIIVEADDNSQTVRLPIKFYCTYIDEYDTYYILNIFVKDMEYA